MGTVNLIAAWFPGSSPAGKPRSADPCWSRCRLAAGWIAFAFSIKRRKLTRLSTSLARYPGFSLLGPLQPSFGDLKHDFPVSRRHRLCQSPALLCILFIEDGVIHVCTPSCCPFSTDPTGNGAPWFHFTISVCWNQLAVKAFRFVGKWVLLNEPGRALPQLCRGMRALGATSDQSNRQDVVAGDGRQMDAHGPKRRSANG